MRCCADVQQTARWETELTTRCSAVESSNPDCALTSAPFSHRHLACSAAAGLRAARGARKHTQQCSSRAAAACRGDGGPRTAAEAPSPAAMCSGTSPALSVALMSAWAARRRSISCAGPGDSQGGA